jgi:hypothetical protein
LSRSQSLIQLKYKTFWLYLCSSICVCVCACLWVCFFVQVIVVVVVVVVKKRM